MDFSDFQVPKSWPPDAKAFSHDARSQIQGLHDTLKKAMADIIDLRGALEKAQIEILSLKDKLGTNSSNSGLPPSKDPPSAPSRETKPTGRKQGAQKGHPGKARSSFPKERVDHFVDVFPTVCPESKQPLSPDELISISFKKYQQVDLPKDIRLNVTEFHLHTCLCPCGCGRTLTAKMPKEAGNTAVGPHLKAVMALLTSRYHLSKAMIQEILIDMFGPDAMFSTGCISEAEKEIADSLEKPYEEAREEVKRAEAVNVDETSWFLKHDLQWLWVAVTNALSVFFIDPERSRAAFERFIGGFEGFIISDRFSAYSNLSPEERQVCWAHLIRDFRKIVDRHGGAEGIGEWALREIETMFDLWHLYMDGVLNQVQLRSEFASLRARFARLLRLGKETSDPKAGRLCNNLLKIWPALWNFLDRPDILQPTNNRAEQAVRQPVIARNLSFGSQSERGLRFTERMLTVVATLRKQGRSILAFLHSALMSFRTATAPPSLLPIPSG
jgi:hypothetical protein